jgi:acyl dehydratase
MAKDIALAEMKNFVGTELGVSDWITVDQSMINAFAKATLDDQFIHTDLWRHHRAWVPHTLAAFGSELRCPAPHSRNDHGHQLRL